MPEALEWTTSWDVGLLKGLCVYLCVSQVMTSQSVMKYFRPKDVRERRASIGLGFFDLQKFSFVNTISSSFLISGEYKHVFYVLASLFHDTTFSFNIFIANENYTRIVGFPRLVMASGMDVILKLKRKVEESQLHNSFAQDLKKWCEKKYE